MATFNDLVRVIAEVEGMDPMTVRGIGIKVREAGMISKSGRGLSAARMTVEDAAALLIGVNGTAMAKDAAEAVRAISGLRLSFDRAWSLDADNVSSPDFHERAQTLDGEDPFERTLRFGTPFFETFSALISTFIPRDDERFSVGLGDKVEVTFRRPVWSASIAISSKTHDEEIPFEAWADVGFEGLEIRHLADDGTDRRDSTTIGERTLMAVGRILAT